MQFWITKYALSSGITLVDADDPVNSEFPGLLTVRGRTGGGAFDQHFHKEGRDWHRSKGAAIKRAEAMRDAKVHNLHLQIKKLEAMKFGP